VLFLINDFGVNSICFSALWAGTVGDERPALIHNSSYSIDGLLFDLSETRPSGDSY
jgi:hypothetical protein